MNEYRGKHAPSHPWPVASSASVRSGPSGRHRKKARRHRFRLIIACLVILAFISYPFIEARLILTTDTHDLLASDLVLPDNMSQLRVVYVSDIHWGFWYSDSDLGRLVSRINHLNPDLVLFGGDYATDNASAITFFNRLQQYKIHVRFSMYGVLGEAEYAGEDPDIGRLKDAMANAKVTPLVNDTAVVRLGNGSQIYLAGADDVTSGTPQLDRLASSVSASDYVIFMAHNPSVIPSAQQQKDRKGSFDWFDLGLFGHTHGGQLRVFSEWLDLAGDVPERYREGWLNENRSSLLISRGVGTSDFPCRLFCFPQIHCIIIKPN